MSHRKLKTIKSKIRQYDIAELRSLLIFIEMLLKSAGKGTRSHRTSKKSSKRSKKPGRRLSVGVHRHVKVGKHFRTVKVLANGKWRFMKG